MIQWHVHTIITCCTLIPKSVTHGAGAPHAPSWRPGKDMVSSDRNPLACCPRRPEVSSHGPWLPWLNEAGVYLVPPWDGIRCIAYSCHFLSMVKFGHAFFGNNWALFELNAGCHPKSAGIFRARHHWTAKFREGLKQAATVAKTCSWRLLPWRRTRPDVQPVV